MDTTQPQQRWAGQDVWPVLDKRGTHYPDPSTITNISDLFSFAHGLTGVDQNMNYYWTDVALVAFISFCAVLLLLRFGNMFTRHTRHIHAASNREKQNFWKYNENWYWAKLKKHLFYAPLGKNRHNREWQLSSAVNMGTLPSRFNFILLILWVIFNVVTCAVLPYNVADKSITIASLRGRSGTLALVNLLPTILFALRSNPLIWLLDVSYDTFNLLHRWCARLVILEALVHTLAWWANTYRAGKWEKVQAVIGTEPSYQWGLVGTVVFLAIGITAWSPVRHAFYETFLNTHRFFVVLSLIGVYAHLDLHNLPQVPWMWFVFAIYGYEILRRIISLIYYNLTFSKDSCTQIEVTALPGEACRLEVRLARAWSPKAGCHAHIFIPSLALWSSHPFSIAWNHPYDKDNRGSPRSESEKLPSSSKDIKDLVSSSLELASRRPKTRKISFVVRAREGMTKKLYEKANARKDKKFVVFGAIEGPYGGHHSLASYGTLVLFAGGVGITHQVNYVQELVQKYNEGTVAARKILLVWSIPDKACLEWIKPWMDQILQIPNRSQVLRIKLFVSRLQRHEQVASQSNTVQMIPGRCPVEHVINEEVLHREGAMAVTVCGPGVFADSVRVAVRNRVDVGVVDFIEEAFSY